jgi:hypothetical protein
VPGPLPRGLLIGLQHDAVVEHASLALIDRPAAYSQLAAIVAKTAITLNADERSVADARHWVRLPGSTARDGVPASAIPAQHGRRPAQRQARLAQRDLDLGRGIGELDQAGPPPAATAILLTPGDTRADWLRAGQALHRLLAHAAGQWVFRAGQGADQEQAGAAWRAAAAAGVRARQDGQADRAPVGGGTARVEPAQVTCASGRHLATLSGDQTGVGNERVLGAIG